MVVNYKMVVLMVLHHKVVDQVRLVVVAVVDT